MRVSSRIFFALRDRTSRPKRIAKGIANPASRPRYIDAARGKLLRAKPLSHLNGERCLVCRAPAVRFESVEFAKDNTRTCRVHICDRCGYIANPENTKDYRGRKNLENLPPSTRIGTPDRPGREYHMARMAVEILDRGNVDVLIYGVGRSFDNHHIEKLARVGHVAIGDIMKFRDDAEFIDLNEPATRRFGVVVASEVIEHFRRPRHDFAKLFEYVERGGLLVCGTNVYDGGPLSQDAYLFYADHTSYYTPRSLATIAHAGGYKIDFRAPLVGPAMRKRYVLFTKSPQVLEKIACYFGAHMYAPSEVPPSKKPRVRKAGGRKPSH